MRRIILFVSLFLVSFTMGCGMTAMADLKNLEGKVIGHATFKEGTGGVHVSLTIEELTPGEHAFHIHELGDCSAKDFKSAGGHYNPHGKKHGHKHKEGKHGGDLPNLEVGEDGKGMLEYFAEGVTLGEGKGSLFKEGGTALVIHAGADDYISQPSGAAGARVCCGEIKKK